MQGFCPSYTKSRCRLQILFICWGVTYALPRLSALLAVNSLQPWVARHIILAQPQPSFPFFPPVSVASNFHVAHGCTMFPFSCSFRHCTPCLHEPSCHICGTLQAGQHSCFAIGCWRFFCPPLCGQFCGCSWGQNQWKHQTRPLAQIGAG